MNKYTRQKNRWKETRVDEIVKPLIRFHAYYDETEHAWYFAVVWGSVVFSLDTNLIHLTTFNVWLFSYVEGASSTFFLEKKVFINQQLKIHFFTVFYLSFKLITNCL